MKPVDLSAVERMIVDVGATEIIPRFKNLAAGDIEMKGVDDPVTVADKAAEDALISKLTAYLPGSVVVGEESFAKDPNIISHFGGEEYVWVIDPIDGTRNFISGVPEFGVMVGLVRAKKTVASWIHDPSSGDTLMAEQGGGVTLRGHKMRLAAHDPALPFVGLVGSRLLSILSKPDIEPLIRDIPTVEKGSSAAFDYGRLFAGPVSFANSTGNRASFLLYRMSKVWDHIPGLFMLSEAKGYAANLRGKPYDIAASKGGLLMTRDEDTWNKVYASFKPALDQLFKKC